MSFIEKYLTGDEKIIYRTKLHWIIFLWPVTLGYFSHALFKSGDTEGVQAVGFIGLGFAVLMMLAAIIDYLTSEFGVTNRRVLIKIGFIRRKSMETLLQKIESIEIEQGILGRMLNFGTVTIIGSGGSNNHFKKIARPLLFRKYVQEQIATK